MKIEKQYPVSRLPEIAMLCISLLVVCAIALLSYRNIHLMEAASEQRSVSREMRYQSMRLLSMLVDAETGQRGFLLTGREQYLEPYNHAVLEIPRALELLKTMNTSSWDHGGNLGRLEQLTLAKLGELNDSIKLYRSGNESQVRSILDSDRGKKLMDEIRMICDGIEEATQNDLISFINAQDESTTRLRVVSMLGSGILFVFLIISAIVISRGMVRRESLYKESEIAKKLLKTTLAGIADGVIATDAGGQITFINPVAQKLTGWGKEEARGRHIREVFAIVNEVTQAEVENPLEKALAEGTAVGLANLANLISRDGSQLPIDDSAAPLQDEHGKLIGAVLVFRDISVRRQSERQLQDAVTALRYSNEELQAFVSAASHDLRSPLNTIKGMAELLSWKFSDQLGDKGKELVGYINKGVTRMTQLLEDLLSFARASHFDAASAKPLPLNNALTASLSNLSGEIAESAAAITSDPLPVVAVHEAHMVQLLQNLIGNALKYRSQHPRIHVSAEQRDGEWIIGVTDNGIGIDRAYAEQIFQPFKRLHGEEYPGSGIGLASCRKIVEGYGGRIWVETEPGRGSTFFFTMPLTEAQVASQ
jgi:PAS domain S-box-containing protein